MANELMLSSFTKMHGLNYNALRFFNIYGPRMDSDGKYTEVIIRWYNMIKNGEQPLIYGDGKQTMDFIYIDDIADACISALKAEVSNNVFNVAFGKETSLEELCYLLLDAMKSDLKPNYIPIPSDRNKVEVMRRLADTTKAKQMMDFQAQVPIKQGLIQLVNWLDKKQISK